MPNRSIWCRKGSIGRWWTDDNYCGASVGYNSKGRSNCGDEQSSDCECGNARVFVGAVNEILKFGCSVAEQYNIFYDDTSTPDSPSRFVLILTINEIINLTCFRACTSDN
mmetsp:Transcript_50867/g.61226  ORF Transcript_50867/g.61226 Transcript_50867/m.61226 type:complete len:110 (-) Transcript_50867:171-500(-)